MPTEAPITFINRPVGSTCTLVADLYARNGITPAAGVAGLLMAGIISDTLNGTSPTATDLDRRMLNDLASSAGILPDDLSAQIFAVGSPLRSMAPQEIIGADSKIYEERGVKFSVSQIEELTFSGFDARQADLLEALRGKVGQEGLFFAALLITDIKTQNSYLLVDGDEEFLRGINYPEYAENVWVLQGVVSRKKQLLPYLTERLASVR
jgi:manganese-dependent inorganic pyrophosphatase